MPRQMLNFTGLGQRSKAYAKGGPIPLFPDTFDTKYRAKNFTDTNSDTNTNPYSYMVACINHQMSYLPLGI